MSTRRTVEVRVSCSVRKTSKSAGERLTPGSPRASRSTARSPAGGARSRSCPGCRGGTGRRTRTASSSPRAPLPGRPGRSGGRRTRRATAGRTGRRGPSGRSAGCRAASARAARPCGSGSRPPRAGGRARRAPRGRGRRPVAEQVARRSSRSRPAEVARRLDRRPAASSSASSAWSWPIRSSAGSRPERLLAAEVVALAEAVGHQLVHVRGEPGEVPAQPVVAEQRVHHRLELGPLLGRHRAQQRLHRGHPLGQLLDDVVERPGAGEEAAVLRRGSRRPRPGSGSRPSSRSSSSS